MANKFWSRSFCDNIERNDVGRTVRFVHQVANEIERLKLWIHYSDDGGVTERVVDAPLFDYPFHGKADGLQEVLHPPASVAERANVADRAHRYVEQAGGIQKWLRLGLRGQDARVGGIG